MTTTFKTKNYIQIQNVCINSLKNNTISFLISQPGQGKTTALKDFCAGRNDVLLLESNFASKGLNLPSGTKLIVLDGIGPSLQSLTLVKNLILKKGTAGLVVAIDIHKKNQTILPVAFQFLSDVLMCNCIVKGDVLLHKLSIIGNRQLIVSSPIFNSLFCQCSSSEKKHSDTVFLLRRPSRTDVQMVGKYYGINKGIDPLYQNGTTIQKLITEIEWKRQSQNHN